MKKSRLKEIFWITTFLLFCIPIVSIGYTNVSKAEKAYQQSIVTLEEQEIEGKNIAYQEQEVLILVNQERINRGMEPLKVTEKLQQVAKDKAYDLLEKAYFSHTSPTYGTPFEMLQDNGIEYKIAGENLAGNSNSKKAVLAWMNSESHRENILENDFLYTGICVIESPIYGYMYVQIFLG